MLPVGLADPLLRRFQVETFALLCMDCLWTIEIFANVGSLRTFISNSPAPSHCLQGQILSTDSRWGDRIGIYDGLSKHLHVGMGTILRRTSTRMW